MKRTADVAPFRRAPLSVRVARKRYPPAGPADVPWLEVLYLPHDAPVAAARWHRGLTTLTALYGLEVQFKYGPLCTASIRAPEGTPSEIVRHGVLTWVLEEPQVRVLREQVAGGKRSWVVRTPTSMEGSSYE